MRKISIDELIDMVDSRYSLVTLISKRARQIIDGQDILIKTPTLKPVCVAIEEFYDKTYGVVYETEQQRQADIDNQTRILEQAEREVYSDN